MNQSYRAFVSSTLEDLGNHRAIVIGELRKAGVNVDPMEDWPADAVEPRVFSVERINGCQLCVLLVAWRRGFIPAGETESVTQLEYRHAVASKIPVLVFLLDPEAPWRLRFNEQHADPAVLAWREELRKAHGTEWFGTEPTSIRVSPAVLRRRLSDADNADSLASVLQPQLADHLRPIRAFVGRKLVFDGVDRWLKQSDGSRGLKITGPPGIGKSALAMCLRDRVGHASAFHVCRHGDSSSSDPRRFTMSIAYQLSEHIDEYQEILRGLSLRPLVEQADAERLFDELVVKPLWQAFPQPRGSALVVVDALDEATHQGHNALAEFVATQFEKTPAWLRLVATCRPESEVLASLCDFDSIELEAASLDNLADLRDYVIDAASHEIARYSLDAAAIDELIDRSEGSFLYAYWVLTELASGRLSSQRPADFPAGLSGVFRDYFRRQFPKLEQYRAGARPALQAICAAQEGVPVPLLAQCLAWREQDTVDFLTATGALFPERHGCVQPFHRSITEWLTEPDRAAPYFVSEKDGHQTLAEFGWRTYEAGKAAAYFQRHLAEHLARAQSWPRLERVLTDPVCLAKAWSAGSIYEWLRYWRMLGNASSPGALYSAMLDGREASGSQGAELATLADRIGWLLGEMEQYTDARRIVERGLTWLRIEYGSEDRRVATSLFGLAELCRRGRDFVAARPMYEQSLAIRRAAGDDAGVAETLHGLGEYFHDQREYEKARLNYEEGAAMAEKTAGWADVTTGKCLNDLGTLHFENGRSDIALPLYKRAEKIFRKVYGPHHPEFASARFNQALIYKEKGDVAQAWPIFLQALEVHERVYPAAHPKVKTCQEALDSALQLLDANAQRTAMERLVDARERAYGHDHEITMSNAEGLAWRLSKIDPVRAVEWARKAVERRTAVNGGEDSATATALNTLVRCLQNAKRFGEALQPAKRALEIRQQRDDVSPETLAVSYNNLGLLYVELCQEPDEAELLLKRCLSLDPTAANAPYWLGRLYEQRSASGQAVVDRNVRRVEAGYWRAYVGGASTDSDRRAYAERRLAELASEEDVPDDPGRVAREPRE